MAAVRGHLGGAGALAALADATAARRVLVVLDNCEHVLDAAAAATDAVCGSGVSVVLATSREPLHVSGERVWNVPPLSEADAVELFSDRARSVSPSFVVTETNRHAVTEICRQLDALPLAIELAATRVRSMSPAEIARRLDDRLRLLRQRTEPRSATTQHDARRCSMVLRSSHRG